MRDLRISGEGSTARCNFDATSPGASAAMKPMQSMNSGCGSATGNSASNFRRQYGIGPYIADFCCVEQLLVVELDGGQHAEQTAKDEERTAYLAKCGFKVLRFWNDQVLTDTDSVLEEILKNLKVPHPHPLPS